MSQMNAFLQSQLPVGLKSLMSKATDVQHWNQLREIAKSEFSQKAIWTLDASGYISQVLKVEKKLVA